MIPENKDEPKTFKQKTSEPILNARQIFAFCMTILYEVVSNLLYFGLMAEPNIIFIIVNISIGIIVILVISLLRAAYPQEVPDKTIWAAFWLIWKQVVDIITDPKSDPDTKMNILEKSIQWDIREWDIAYQDKLSQQIEYYKTKLNEKIETIEKQIEESKL